MKRASQVGWLSKKTLEKKRKVTSSDDDLARIDVENASPSIETPDISREESKSSNLFVVDFAGSQSPVGYNVSFSEEESVETPSIGMSFSRFG